jgi:hypothetical protein
MHLPSGGSSAPETAICPSCGSLYLSGESYCPACGVFLAPVPGAPPGLPHRVDRSAGAAAKGSPPAPAEDTRREAPPPEAESVPGRLRLEANSEVLEFPPGKPRLVIGRADIAASFFPDIDLEACQAEKLGVSRRHAILITRNGQVYLQDLNSTNFTYVNHTLLPPGQRILLQAGDVIRLGRLTLCYERLPA